jgi:monothiol glutaredoxin
MDDAVKQRIEEDIKNNKVFLYMKGSPEFPMCGFSAQVIEVLKTEGVEFGSCNILEDEAVRGGIKEYADWPTIPQLYAGGEFVGGCDIIVEMHQSGELAKVLAG